MNLNQWVDKKASEISSKLPTLVHSEAASFSCGYNTGYKQCLLDVERFINRLEYLNHKGLNGFDEIN